MSAALGLLRLQQVDSRIDHVQAELDRIATELENNAVATAARQALRTAQDDQQEAEVRRQRAEQEASAVRLKLQQAEASLYGGKVRNPKELQDLQAEVASLKKHLVSLDADEVAWMEKLEAADSSSRAASTRLDDVLVALEAGHAQLRARQLDLQREKENLLTERGATANAVSGAWRDSYDGLRRARRGMAVVAIEDGACGACGTGLTPAMQQNVRHAQDLTYCPSCGRILYAD